MKSPQSLSVIVPALNEEANLKLAIETVIQSASRYFPKFEILIFNDGSTDQTGAIAEGLARIHSFIKVFHHKKPLNLGAVYKRGIQEAQYEFVIMIPGDNENPSYSIDPVLEAAGKADVIIPYTINQEVRALSRRLLSQVFVKLLNVVSGCRLKYYNGTVLHRTRLIKKVGIQTDGFGYQAEALLKLIKAGHSYYELPIRISSAAHAGRKSKALRLKNLIAVAKFMLHVAIDIRFSTVK